MQFVSVYECSSGSSTSLNSKASLRETYSVYVEARKQRGARRQNKPAELATKPRTEAEVSLFERLRDKHLAHDGSPHYAHIAQEHNKEFILQVVFLNCWQSDSCMRTSCMSLLHNTTCKSPGFLCSGE